MNTISVRIYRKIYEEHFGKIPIDSEGRSYEIHHKDGNHFNNDISNLSCLSITDHYHIHYEQKDFGACFAILKRMKLSASEFSDKCREIAILMGKENKLFFQTDRGREFTRNWNILRAKNGTHPGQSPEFRELCRKNAKLRNSTLVTCPHCDKVGGYVNMKRYHFDKCKTIKSSILV